MDGRNTCLKSPRWCGWRIRTGRFRALSSRSCMIALARRLRRTIRCLVGVLSSLANDQRELPLDCGMKSKHIFYRGMRQVRLFFPRERLLRACDLPMCRVGASNVEKNSRTSCLVEPTWLDLSFPLMTLECILISRLEVTSGWSVMPRRSSIFEFYVQLPASFVHIV